MFILYCSKGYRALILSLLLVVAINHVSAEQAITPNQAQQLIAELAPGFRHNANRDADTLLSQARITGDGRYWGMAETKLSQIDNVTERRLLRAEILQGQHRFEAAEALLNSVIEQQPGNRKALLMLAAIQRQQGRIDTAKQSCMRLLFINQSLSQDCLFAAALGQQQHQFQLSDNQTGQTETNLWRDLLRAEYAETQGQTDQAQALYRQIWQRGETLTVEAWTQYAHFLRRQERHFELKQLLHFAPATGELKSLLAYVQKETVLKEASLDEAALEDADRTALAEQIALQERHPAAKRHAAEIAWYYHLNTRSSQWALHWAQINWRIQRSLRDAELLVRTALVAGDESAIDQVTDWMTRHRINDQRLIDLLSHDTAIAGIRP